jgi:AhpD family alkylhydroperoxidase
MLKLYPEANKKFADFYQEVFKDGKLSVKIKELIAVGVALAGGCDACYEHHLKKARECGNSDEEIREAIAVAEVLGTGKVRMMVKGEEERFKEKGL